MHDAAVLVTGANGFIGRALCRALEGRGHAVRAAARTAEARPKESHDRSSVVVGEIGPDTEWDRALEDIDVVVHLAARVHVMREVAADPLAEYRRVNTAGTERLAWAAARAGVKRFVFMSSIKANGEETHDRPFTEADPPHPVDAYGISKWEAEQALKRVSEQSGLEVVILRPPLVYGPGIGGNFLSLWKAIDKGFPLPLGAIHNRRSLIYLGNLVDAVLRCIEHPAAAGKTYVVRDGEDVSTPELVRRIAKALGRPAKLLPFPVPLLTAAMRVTGKSELIARLLGSLTVDDSLIRSELGWARPYSMAEGLGVMAQWHQELTGH
jgi:nucleoside-diphosphate-sugar epimerase